MIIRIVPLALMFVAMSSSAVSRETGGEIRCTKQLIEFAQAVAAPTALAESGDEQSVKLMLVGMKRGMPVVSRVGLLPSNTHGPAKEFARGSPVLMIHVHHEGMLQAPHLEDAASVRELGIPNVIVSADGQSIWEVGIIGGEAVYRDISTEDLGPWQPLDQDA